ncbi:MAG: twin-arginine translocation pathway signal, partial [Pseudomonadota bacterium]
MNDLSRRGFLTSTLGVACSAAAAPLLTPVRLAAAEGENRLVTIVLRGAMDAVGVFAPHDDPNFTAMRPFLKKGGKGGGYIDLDGRFGMDARLGDLAPFWKRGELAIAHAVSTPYRGKRSHFDGQDLLEAGVGQTKDVGDGWLNRALTRMGGAHLETAVSVGDIGMLLTQGDTPVRSWSPGAELSLQNDERQLLTRLYADDPLFAQAARMATELSDLGGGEGGSNPTTQVAAYAADRLRAEARIAAFSINGWDTHANQRGALNRPLKALS